MDVGHEDNLCKFLLCWVLRFFLTKQHENDNISMTITFKRYYFPDFDVCMCNFDGKRIPKLRLNWHSVRWEKDTKTRSCFQKLKHVFIINKINKEYKIFHNVVCSNSFFFVKNFSPLLMRLPTFTLHDMSLGSFPIVRL